MLIYVKAVHYDFYKRRIDELVAQFPGVFDKRFPMPLSIGIHKQLAERTDFTPKEISVLLRIWTHRIEYLAMGCSIGARINLDGLLTLISAEHRQGFIAAHKLMGTGFIKRFSKSFKEQFGRPAFIAVPIKDRKDIYLAEKEKGCCGGTKPDCKGCENCG